MSANWKKKEHFFGALRAMNSSSSATVIITCNVSDVRWFAPRNIFPPGPFRNCVLACPAGHEVNLHLPSRAEVRLVSRALRFLQHGAPVVNVASMSAAQVAECTFVAKVSVFLFLARFAFFLWRARPANPRPPPAPSPASRHATAIRRHQGLRSSARTRGLGACPRGR